MPAQTPELGDLLEDLAARVRGGVGVAIPAQVVTYDPVRQAVTAKPTVSGRYHDAATGALVPFPLPAVANVPVAFPSGGGFAITWPLLPGDPVFLVLADRSIDEWKSLGAPENVPIDVRRHDLTDAVAVPGLRPFASPLPATSWSPTAMVLEGTDIRIGSSAAASPVALAPLVDAVLATLKVWLDTHVHGSAGTPPTAPSPDPGPVAAVKVKAE